MTKSSLPQVKIVNAETGEEIIRDANADELAQFEIDKANELARLSAIEVRKASRQALLSRLGITEEEARILLGGN